MQVTFGAAWAIAVAVPPALTGLLTDRDTGPAWLVEATVRLVGTVGEVLLAVVADVLRTAVTLGCVVDAVVFPEVPAVDVGDVAVPAMASGFVWPSDEQPLMRTVARPRPPTTRRIVARVIGHASSWSRRELRPGPPAQVNILGRGRLSPPSPGVPSSQNSELRTQNSELRTQDSELRTQNSEL